MQTVSSSPSVLAPLPSSPSGGIGPTKFVCPVDAHPPDTRSDLNSPEFARADFSFTFRQFKF